MQQTTTLGFNGGFNSDLYKAYYDGNTYLEATNFTATTTGGSTLGALENAKGNELVSSLSFGTDQEIIGYANVVEDLVIFTTSNGEYDEELYDTSDDLDGISMIHFYDTSEDELTTLYSDEDSTSKLNFVTNAEYRIVGVGREETSLIKKVYWVDGKNEFRYIDLNRDYTGLEATVFNSIPVNDLTLTIEQDIINGSGSYTAGTVYHAVQFYVKNGASSTVTQHTMPIKLSEYSGLKDGGTDSGDDANCSIQVTISDIPDEILNQYNRIRLYSIYYTTYGSDPAVNIVSERSLLNDSIIIVDTGEYIDESSLSELLTLNQTTYIPQAIASKDNYLFLGNLQEDTFTSDAIDEWDSRAYRFNSSGVSKIYDTSETYEIELDSTIKVVSTTYSDATVGEDVPEDFDCFNPYNNIYDTTLYDKITNSTDYRYQSDGSTIGGEGINVSYHFENDTRTIDSNARTGASESSTFVVTNQSDEYSTYGDLIECEDGEVYRVGIRFFNDKGQSSFVKWIGDILWEESLSSDDMKTTTSTSDNQYSNARVLVVNVSNLPDDDSINAFQIVRCVRDSTSTSIVASGLLQPITEINSDDVYTLTVSNRISTVADGTALFRFVSPNLMFNDGGEISISSYKFRTYNKISDYEWDIATFGDDSDQHGYGYKFIGLGSLDTGTAYQSYSNLSTIEDSEWAEPQYAQDDYTDSVITVNGYQYLNQQDFSDDNDYAAGCSALIVALTDDIYIEDDDLAETTSHLYSSIIKNNTLTRYGGSSYQDILNSEYIPFSKPKSSALKVDFTTSGESTAGSNVLTDMLNTDSFSVGDLVKLTIVTGDTIISSTAITDIDSDNSTITIEDEIDTSYATIFVSRLEYDTLTCVYGDVYTNPFYFMNLLYYDDDTSTKDGAFCMTSFPVTTKMDLRRRSDRMLDFYTGTDDIQGVVDDADIMFLAETTTTGIELQADVYDTDIGDLYTYNTAYSCENEAMMSYAKPYDYDNNSVSTTKIIASDKKTNGESEDNWTNFSSGDYIEIDSAYGGVNDLMLMDSTMFFWQDKAFGKLAINDRSVISDSSGSQVSLGSGDVLERYDYISTEVGNRDKYSISKSDNAIFWYYSPRDTINRFNGNLEEISTSAGISNHLASDPATNPISVSDFLAKETIFKLGSKVLVYDWLNGKFTSNYTYLPEWLIPEFDGNFLSSGDSINVYRHNSDDVIRGTYYGVANDSTIKHICNKDFDITKVFDVMNWHSTSLNSGVNQYGDTFSTYRIYNDYQNTDWQTVDWKRKERSFTTIIPRDRVNAPQSDNVDIFDDSNIDSTQTYKRRIRDKYIIIDLEYVNLEDTKFSVPYLNIGYRASIR
jgi:hypothetical protein